MPQPYPARFPLCDYFFSRYLSRNPDQKNFPPQDISGVFERNEKLFSGVPNVLGLTREQLRGKSEFNFESGNAANLEGGVAILRVVELLRLNDFTNISLVCPPKGKQGADIIGDKNDLCHCLEVKAVTKQSQGSDKMFLADQLYEKIRDHATRAAKQLDASAVLLRCNIKILVYVINWFDQSIYLAQSDYQQMVDRLERDGDVHSLRGIDGVWFVTKMGHSFAFMNECGEPSTDGSSSTLDQVGSTIPRPSY